jgi:hypothetical protein
MENNLASVPTESAAAIVQGACSLNLRISPLLIFLIFFLAVDPSAPPPKRKPGRPKGSGKKPPPDPAIITERVKRPVGRPRKDGLPAGSVGARRANQLRRSSVKMSTEAPQLPPGIPFAGVRDPGCSTLPAVLIL